MRGDTTTRFAEAVAEAHYRAALTGWRYRCRKSQSNQRWWITETSYRVRNWPGKL